MPRPNIDVFGHCINCGKNMIVHEYVDGKTIQRFTGDKSEVTYILNDGSEMRVSSCASCVDKLTGSDEEYEEVMKTVVRGWQHEVETYSRWDEKKKVDYITKQKELSILVRSDDKPKDVVKKIFKERKSKDSKKVKKDK